MRLLLSSSPLRGWLKGTAPEAVLLRSTLLFVALDVFFTGLVGAYAFSREGVLGVLLFIVVQQACTSLGHLFANLWMRRPTGVPARVQRAGVLGLALILVAAGGLPWSHLALLALLSAGGGFSRGLTYGARLWREALLSDPSARQQYLSLVEAVSTLFKVLAPGWALVVLAVTPRFELVYLSAGLACLAVLWATQLQAEPLSRPEPLNLRRFFLSPQFRATAPYFVVEGAGHALRTALFVSGAMTVVGSLKGYAVVEMSASVCAALWLVMQSRVKAPGPSMAKLRLFLAMLALAWAALLAALWYPVALPIFVVAYALSVPLVSAQKAGVTLGGLARTRDSLANQLMARSILLMLSRVLTLTGFVTAYALGATSAALLVSMTAAAIMLLPLEYWTAKRMRTDRPASKPR